MTQKDVKLCGEERYEEESGGKGKKNDRREG